MLLDVKYTIFSQYFYFGAAICLHILVTAFKIH